MGKSWKSQAEYDYCHDNKEVKGKLLVATKGKILREVLHTGYWKNKRNRKRIKDLDRDGNIGSV